VAEDPKGFSIFHDDLPVLVFLYEGNAAAQKEENGSQEAQNGIRVHVRSCGLRRKGSRHPQMGWFPHVDPGDAPRK